MDLAPAGTATDGFPSIQRLHLCPKALAFYSLAMGSALAIALGWLTSTLGASPEPARASLDPQALRARTPPDDAWSTLELDPRTYFAPEERLKVGRRAAASRRLALVIIGVDLLWYACFLLTSWAARLRDGCGRVTRRLARRWAGRGTRVGRLAAVPRHLFGEDWAEAWLFAWAYFGLGTAVTLPLALWAESLEQSAGLSSYGAEAWAWDTAKQATIQLVLFSCLVLGIYGLVRRLPRWWWLVLGLPAGLALVLYGLAEPHLTRIYDDVSPLEMSTDPAHRALLPRVRALARAEGVSLARVQVIRASRTTRTLDARLVGLGASRELLLYDTLLAEASPREVEVAVAHELGHEHHRRDLLTYGGGAIALLGLLGLLAVVLRWGGRRRAMRGPGDVATLPVMGFTLWIAFQTLQPALAWRKREHEREADRRALVLTADPEAFVRLQVRLAVRNQQELTPPRWMSVLWSTHPPAGERISAARWYAGWLRQRGYPVPDALR